MTRNGGGACLQWERALLLDRKKERMPNEPAVQAKEKPLGLLGEHERAGMIMDIYIIWSRCGVTDTISSSWLSNSKRLAANRTFRLIHLCPLSRTYTARKSNLNLELTHIKTSGFIYWPLASFEQATKTLLIRTWLWMPLANGAPLYFGIISCMH